MAFESFITSVATVVGGVTLIKLVYNISFVLWLHFLRPSQLHKYRDANLSSWALVTGTSDGIGLELARELLAQGFNVFIHGRNETKLEGVKKSLLEQHPERSVDIIVADAADPNVDYDAIVKKANSVSGPLTVLINCVGGITTNPIYIPLDGLSGADIDTNIAINARFPTRLTSALLPTLKENSPSLIINAGSYAGVFGLPLGAAVVFEDGGGSDVAGAGRLLLLRSGGGIGVFAAVFIEDGVGFGGVGGGRGMASGCESCAGLYSRGEGGGILIEAWMVVRIV